MLKPLDPKALNPARDYLRDVALAVGSLQRGFLPVDPHDWQHGLEVTMRGIKSQPFSVDGREVYVLLDLVKNKVRLGEAEWALSEYAGPEIFKNFKVWLESQNIKANLEQPDFAGGKFDESQSKAYAEVLWWIHKQFQIIKAEMSTGTTAPILLYPHHFDLSLVWYPWNNDKQISIGFSTGDETIPEPYIYLTLYPEPKDLVDLLAERMPKEAYWQKQGFSGGILPYSKLQESDHPEDLLRQFVGQVSAYAVANSF